MIPNNCKERKELALFPPQNIAYDTSKTVSLQLTTYQYNILYIDSISRFTEYYKRFLPQALHLYEISGLASYTEAFIGKTKIYALHPGKSNLFYNQYTSKRFLILPLPVEGNSIIRSQRKYVRKV